MCVLMKMNISRMMKSCWKAAAPAVLAIILCGCFGPGYRRSDAAASDAQVASVQVLGVIRDLELATNTLQELVSQPAADAKPQYLRFSEAVNRLEHTSSHSLELVRTLGRNRAPYFQIWDKELAAIKDEEVRRRSQARRDEVRKQFDDAIRQSFEAHDSVQPLLAYLRDVRKAISTDLTFKGLASVQPLLARTGELSGQAKGRLGQLATDLDALGARLSSYRVQEGK